MIARVVGLGQRAAGDDGVGLAILDRLRERAPPGVDLVELAEASALIPLMSTSVPLVIVDAIVVNDRDAGDVVEFDADELTPGLRAVSSHGLDLRQAIAIGRAIATREASPPSIRVIGIAVDPPLRGVFGLSSSVADAIPRAVQAVWARVIGSAEPMQPSRRRRS